MTYWSIELFELLQEMAAANTNAVLTLLASENHVQPQCHYPENGLCFACGYWRAYYHCHDTLPMHSNEHGHFHLFTDIGNKCWAHVAGLSIDADGQALQWFTVNRWVTDGPWLETSDFTRQLKYISVKKSKDSLVSRWLGSLLQLYRDDLYSLLVDREKQLQCYAKGRNRTQIMDDRDLYQLNVQKIDLSQMLEKYLLANNASIPGVNKNNKQVLIEN